MLAGGDDAAGDALAGVDEPLDGFSGFCWSPNAPQPETRSIKAVTPAIAALKRIALKGTFVPTKSPNPVASQAKPVFLILSIDVSRPLSSLRFLTKPAAPRAGLSVR
jgi:hypothetical protein